MLKQSTLTYPSGVMLVMLAGVLWSTQGLAMRTIGEASPWAILFFRSLSMTVFLIPTVRVSGLSNDRVSELPWFPVFLGGGALAVAFAAGILAMQSTSIAGAVVLFATAPLFTAVLSLTFLGEPVSRMTWGLILVAMSGIVVMQGGNLAAADLGGAAFALLSAFGFAVFTVILRWGRGSNMMICVLVSGPVAMVLSALATSLLGLSLWMTSSQTVVALLMGVTQTGGGLVLYTIGSRVVPAMQLAMFPLLEIVLSPLWVAVFFTEVPPSYLFIGGAIVVAAVILQVALSVGEQKTT